MKHTVEIRVKEIKAKTILRRHKKVDSWFVTRYGMNLYRGCTHNCVYCDGRAEKYNVEGEFGCTVAVKVNAPEVLSLELDPSGKRVPLKPGYIMVGGGVGDAYQPVEERYELTRKVLELLCRSNRPIHILTKSTLVERDLDLIREINDQKRAIVSFSFSSVDDRISAVFEPGVPPPSRRLETMARLKKEGIACGMYLMPVIPFITDTPEKMEETIQKARDIGVDFVVLGAMTLKEGRQKDYFHAVLNEHYPHLLPEYAQIYSKNKWGGPIEAYSTAVNEIFLMLAGKYKIPVRIPLYLFRDYVDQNDLAVVILEHIDYLLRLRGGPSPYGHAAYSVSQLNEPLSKMQGRLRSLKGVGKVTESILREIIRTGTSTYYERLLSP
jgi:DNA repair photolyase